MEYRNIYIFVAGAIALLEERKGIKASVNDLNADLEKRGIHVSLRSFENFRDNQDAYNDFIRNKAELILFILDGKIGEYTRTEFLLANKLKSQSGHPEIIVFVHDFKEETADIKYIEGLMAGSTGDYWVTYNDIPDLIVKAEKRIRQFVLNRNLPTKSTKKGFSLLRLLMPVVFALTAMVAFLAGRNLKPEEHNTALLLVGGGSAANFIDNNFKEFNLRDFPEGYYVHMPSADAWLMMTEEVTSPQSDSLRRYIPLCLSANEANDSAFLRVVSKEHFLQKGSVVAFKLGYDTLMVYAKSTPRLRSLLPNAFTGEITSEELSNLIYHAPEDRFDIFTTSKNSGTRIAYNTVLNNIGLDFANVNTQQFSEDTDLAVINRNPDGYILLGSTCYFMKKLKASSDASQVLELKVIDSSSDNRAPSVKPIFLYCMAYVQSGNILEFPKETLHLLDVLNVRDALPGNGASTFERSTINTVILTPEQLTPVR